MTTGRTTVLFGEASVSFGKVKHGRDRIIANAPSTDEGFEDMAAALTVAHWRYTDEDGAMPQ